MMMVFSFLLLGFCVHFWFLTLVILFFLARCRISGSRTFALCLFCEQSVNHSFIPAAVQGGFFLFIMSEWSSKPRVLIFAQMLNANGEKSEPKLLINAPADHKISISPLWTGQGDNIAHIASTSPALPFKDDDSMFCCKPPPADSTSSVSFQLSFRPLSDVSFSELARIRIEQFGKDPAIFVRWFVKNFPPVKWVSSSEILNFLSHGEPLEDETKWIKTFHWVLMNIRNDQTDIRIRLKHVEGPCGGTFVKWQKFAFPDSAGSPFWAESPNVADGETK